MNVHVFNDHYGLYPSSSAETIVKLNEGNNIIINLAKSQSIASQHITLVRPDKASIKNYISTLAHIDKIILHPLTYESAYFIHEVIKKFPHIKIYWVCWSYDIYNYHYPPEKIYGHFSLAWVSKDIRLRSRNLFKRGLLNAFIALVFPLKSHKKLQDAYKRINYFCSFLEEDYHVAKTVSGNSSMQYLPFSYLTINEIIDIKKGYTVSGNTIMLGHAASPESNHYEMIEDLHALSLERKFLVPMVYGHADYKAAIETHARKYLQPAVEILSERLSSTDYFVKLQEVSHAVFNLRIQQALGNLLGLLYLGVKLFLREETTTFMQFKKWGLIVYRYDEMKTEIKSGLTPKQIIINREIVLDLFNEKRIFSYWHPLTNE
jgi:hypothetical protein